MDNLCYGREVTFAFHMRISLTVKNAEIIASFYMNTLSLLTQAGSPPPYGA